jgi:hypothetical protein
MSPRLGLFEKKTARLKALRLAAGNDSSFGRVLCVGVINIAQTASTNSGSPVSDRWTRPDAYKYGVQIPGRREDNAGRTRTATSDAPAHCRSSLAYSRRSNETIRSHDTRYRQNTLENPGGLARLRWLPSKSPWAHAYAQQALGNAMSPLQPDPPSPAPIWICPSCQKLMRTRTIEVADGEEQTKLVCATCGAEATQSKMLSD